LQPKVVMLASNQGVATHRVTECLIDAFLDGEKMTTAKISADLQSLQRERSIILKSRNMQANRLQAVVAGTLGYHSGMPKKERMKKFKEAADVISAVANDEASHKLRLVIKTTLIGIDAFEEIKKSIEKSMVSRAKKLPVAEWVHRPEQRGFGLLFLAIVIGETGDLSGYANPAKVWRRLGCAPHSFDGKTLMGATWRSKKEGKLPSSEWKQFGYSPRRRSIAFLIGEGIVKQNTVSDNSESSCEIETSFAGPYRSRYDSAKAAAQVNHPDWKPLRCHRHAMLLATKMLLKHLWIEWNGGSHEYAYCGDLGNVTECVIAA